MFLRHHVGYLLSFLVTVFTTAFTVAFTTTTSFAAESAVSPPISTSGIDYFSRSKGKAFNPDITANFLGLWQQGTGLSDDRTQENHNGFSLQEAELQFTSDVDPYVRAIALLSIHQEPGSVEYGIDPEEIFLESISLPRVTLKAGKFRTAFGKHNQLHTHAFPFIDAPLIHQTLLGDEGLNEIGVSASTLMPTRWYSELIFQAFTNSNEDLYNGPKSGQMSGLARIKNLWDLNDSLTAELGLSGTVGKNSLDLTSSVLGADLTFKWRPLVGGKYQALIWSTEYLGARRKGFTDSTTGLSTENLGGIASWIQYQFAQRWWVQARYEQMGIPREVGYPVQRKQSALIGFIPSEFNGLRLQYDRLADGARNKPDHTIAFQYNISIGAHPAHAY
jgi:hypothetical protein